MLRVFCLLAGRPVTVLSFLQLTVCGLTLTDDAVAAPSLTASFSYPKTFQNLGLLLAGFSESLSLVFLWHDVVYN